jgi:hypothetical protein
MFLEKLVVVQVVPYCTELGGLLPHTDPVCIRRHEEFTSSHPIARPVLILTRFPGNMTRNLQVLDLTLDLLGIHQVELQLIITILILL